MPNHAGVAELADAQDLGSCTERCRGSTPLSCIATRTARMWIVRSLALVSVVLSFVASAGADTVWVGTAGKALERKNMKIENLTADGLIFRSASSDRPGDPKPLKEIARIQVDSEPALTAAEAAYATQKWDEAAKGYQRTISTS